MTDVIPWGPTGELVYNRTYSRVKPNGMRETWPETVERVVDGNLALGDPRHEVEDERDDLIRMMTEFKIIPAGRHLWASGVKGRQYLFNCHVSGWDVDPAEHFRFTFLRLMEGGGVGANYSNAHLQRYPEFVGWYKVHIVCDPEHPDYAKMLNAGVLSSEFDSDWPGAFPVEDSREGWAEALTDLLRTYYAGAEHLDRVYDVSRVRSEGSRLKTFGGRASGPLPLAVMLREVSVVMNRESPSKLDGIDAMEIDHAVAQCVVSGGNRRSARMAIMRWDDPQIMEFINLKANGGHWTTNISVEVDDEFWHEVSVNNIEAAHVLRCIAEGMLHNGEPGIWNSTYSNVGEPNPILATNPCLTGETVIATIDGPRTFADLAEDGRDVEVYSWDPVTKRPVVRWMRRPHKTRENAELLKVTFDSGLVVRCTPDHEFYTFRGKKVKAKDLMGLRSKSIRAFSASRDGSGHERVHGWDSKRNAADHQWTHRMRWENKHGPIPDEQVIAHLDHNARNNDLSNLAVMTAYEHASYDYPLRAMAGFNGHSQNHKVVSVEPGGCDDVYNGMVEGSHTYIVLDHEPIAGHMSGIVSANCGEIPLESWENCNLGHLNLGAFVNDEGSVDSVEMYRAHRLMTRFLMRATNGDVTDPKQAEVLARNRRIGVGHLGVATFLAKQGIKYSEAPENGMFAFRLSALAESVECEARRYAHDLRIPVPVKTRTIAPTGTIAKLPGVSEGIHPIFAKYFIRRVRFSDVDEDQRKTVEWYRSEGYDVEPDQYAAETTVVAIPTMDSLMAEVAGIYGEDAAEDVVESAADLTMQDMLAFQELYQTYWADNAVSYTVNIDPDEYDDEWVADLLTEYGPQLKGATVFPEMSMPQSPYERLTRDEFLQLSSPDVTEWFVEDSVDEECASGACPVR